MSNTFNSTATSMLSDTPAKVPPRKVVRNTEVIIEGEVWSEEETMWVVQTGRLKQTTEAMTWLDAHDVYFVVKRETLMVACDTSSSSYIPTLDDYYLEIADENYALAIVLLPEITAFYEQTGYTFPYCEDALVLWKVKHGRAFREMLGDRS